MKIAQFFNHDYLEFLIITDTKASMVTRQFSNYERYLLLKNSDDWEFNYGNLAG